MSNEALATLLVHTFRAQDCRALAQWAATEEAHSQHAVIGDLFSIAVTGEASGVRGLLTSAELLAVPKGQTLTAVLDGLAAGDGPLSAAMAVLESVGRHAGERAGVAIPGKVTQIAAERAEFRLEAPWRVVGLGQRVFAVVRSAGVNGMDRVLCMMNISNEHELVSPDFRVLLGTRNAVHDLISNRRFNVHGPSFLLQPYQSRWLTA